MVGSLSVCILPSISGLNVEINNRKIGEGHPCYIIAEVGINHNGDLETARQLLSAAASAGVDAVKTQVRTLPGAIPEHMRDMRKQTPWGEMSYLAYKERIELSKTEHRDLASYSRSLGLDYGVSVWDTASAHYATDDLEVDFLKIPSALISNEPIVHHTATRGLPFFWSTGMHTMTEIQTTRRWLDDFTFSNWGVLHCNSSYPAKTEELNLGVIRTWQNWSLFRGHPIGYSGHETGLATTVAAVALGASIVERHITLDRAAWGSDHAASVEPQGFRRMVKDIRTVELAIGDGVKRVYESEEVKRLDLTPTV